MGVNKLDIEFEDDEEIQAREEAERKKREVVDNVDIQFGDVDGEGTPPKGTAQPKAAPTQQKASASAHQKASAPARGIQSASPQQSAPASAPSVNVGADYKLGDELKKVSKTNQVLAIEIEARVKVEVAQKMTKTIADFHAQNKLLEHKINKLLTQMHKKAPPLKAELMQIKKLLKEHASLDEDTEEESSNEALKRPVKKKAA